ncbi:MAG TPA: SOS response-associated peptidase [Gemmataceae bacterium]|jgi:putative SOS response-associated peptidase YedK
MCNRYTLDAFAPDLAANYHLVGAPQLPARFNIAPLQFVPVIGLKPDRTTRGLAMMRWGLVPRWSRGSRPRAYVTARAETAHELPAFCDSVRHRRCLIPASGFYEWAREGVREPPYHFRRRDGGPMTFAGLWDRWTGPAGPVLTCCILTTRANELVRPVQDRMPAVLGPAVFARWLDPAADVDDVRRLLRPCQAGELEAVPVSTLVNDVWNDGPDLLAPVVGPPSPAPFARPPTGMIRWPSGR